MKPGTMTQDAWPDLPLAAWSDSADTLHRWFQIAGKVRLALTPRVNHSWSATLYVTARGLTTGLLPHDRRGCEIRFDFVSHRLVIESSDGGVGGFALEPRTVADFYARLMAEMTRLDLPVRINSKPNELADATPFARDDRHRAYDAGYANRFWRILVQADRVFQVFRARFIGKCSPVHFFWGAPDLAVTRFSGRKAPVHPGGIPNLPDRITREAYSHEVSSCGFWWGGGPVTTPAFYSYAYPEPPGFAQAAIGPAGAAYHPGLGEFVLPYDIVRRAESPDDTLLEFLETTYQAAARLSGWDRDLDRGGPDDAR